MNDLPEIGDLIVCIEDNELLFSLLKNDVGYITKVFKKNMEFEVFFPRTNKTFTMGRNFYKTHYKLIKKKQDEE